MRIITPFQADSQSEDNVVWIYLEFGMAQKYVDDLSKNVKRVLRAEAESGWLSGPRYSDTRSRERSSCRRWTSRSVHLFGPDSKYCNEIRSSAAIQYAPWRLKSAAGSRLIISSIHRKARALSMRFAFL